MTILFVVFIVLAWCLWHISRACTIKLWAAVINSLPKYLKHLPLSITFTLVWHCLAMLLPGLSPANIRLGWKRLTKDLWLRPSESKVSQSFVIRARQITLRLHVRFRVAILHCVFESSPWSPPPPPSTHKQTHPIVTSIIFNGLYSIIDFRKRRLIRALKYDV